MLVASLIFRKYRINCKKKIFAKSAVPQILNFCGLDTAGVSVRLTFCNFALKIHALLILYFLPTRRSIYRFAIETLSLKMSEKCLIRVFSNWIFFLVSLNFQIFYFIFLAIFWSFRPKKYFQLCFARNVAKWGFLR